MRKSINQFCFPADMPLVDCLRLAASAGFAGFEPNVVETTDAASLKGKDAAFAEAFTLETTPQQAAELAARVRTLGLQIPSIATGLHWRYPLTDPDEARRERGVAVAEHMLRLAKAVGARTILVVPGLVTPEVSYRTAYARAVEALRFLGGVAARQGVAIGVENVWNKFLLSPLEMRRFLEEVGSPAVRAYFDAGNVLAFGYPEHWVEVLGDVLEAVHVKDFRTGVGNIHGFVPLLTGDLNWPVLMSALRRAGYDGYITVEVPASRLAPELGVRGASDAMDAILAM